MQADAAERLVERFTPATVLVLTFRVTDVNQLAERLDAGGRDTARLLVAHAHKAVLA